MHTKSYKDLKSEKWEREREREGGLGWQNPKEFILRLITIRFKLPHPSF